MKWTPVESSAFRAAAYAEGHALLYLLFRRGELYRYLMFRNVSIKSFWQRIPKADTSGKTFGGASVTSECAGRSDDHHALEKFS